MYKTIEVLGRRHDRLKRNAAVNCSGTNSPEGGNDGSGSASGSGDTQLFESRTMDSSSDEAPLRGIRQCNEAVTKEYRIPGQY